MPSFAYSIARCWVIVSSPPLVIIGTAAVTVHQSDVVGSRDLGGLGHLSRIGNDVEAPFDKPFHNSRADPLRGPRYDHCFPIQLHISLPFLLLSGVIIPRRALRMRNVW